MSRVSVITATFELVKSGRVSSFRQMVSSVLRQSYADIEHIVIDGGSRDGTTDLLDRYARQGCLRYVSEPDGGVYEAMNKGARLATGDYVVFLNSDDWWHDEEGIARSVAALESSHADFSFAPSFHYSPDGRNLTRFMPPRIGRFFLLMPFCHQTMLTRRSVFWELGGFRSDKFKSAGDFDFILRLCLAGKSHVMVDDPFTSYRLGGLSDANQERSLAECVTAMTDAFGAFDPSFDGVAARTALSDHRLPETVFRAVCRVVSPAIRKEMERLPKRKLGDGTLAISIDEYSYEVPKSRRTLCVLGIPVLRICRSPDRNVLEVLGLRCLSLRRSPEVMAHAIKIAHNATMTRRQYADRGETV